jgi:hypothetical protein
MPIIDNGSVHASGAFGAILACLSAESKAQCVNINGFGPYSLIVHAATLAPEFLKV